MIGKLDLDRLAELLTRIGKLLAIAASSSYPGEVVNAVRMTDRALRAAGVVWGDLVAIFKEYLVAVETAKVLLDENERLRAEVERLRAEASRGAAAAVWQDVGARTGNHHDQAQWVVDLHDRGDIRLTEREFEFVSGSILRWHGRLTSQQQQWFEAILTRIVVHTGLTPPS